MELQPDANQSSAKPSLGFDQLYSLSGQRLLIPTVTLEPHTATSFDLRAWVSAAEFEKGSLQVKYYGADRVVAGMVTITQKSLSLLFDQQLTEVHQYFKSSRLDGVWWLPSRGAAMSLVVSNTSEIEVSTTVTLYGPHRKQFASHTISLLAHQTRVIDSRSLLAPEKNDDLPKIGGITVSHTGSPGSVIANLLIQDSTSGYSAIEALRDPQMIVSSKLDGAGLRIGKVAGEQLTQVAVARNIEETDAIVSGRIVYTKRDGSQGIIPIEDTRLDPGEVSTINLATAIKRSRVEKTTAAGLEFNYSGRPGSVVISALSVSDSKNQIFRVPLVDAAGYSQPTNSGKYHLTIEPDASSVVYLKECHRRTASLYDVDRIFNRSLLSGAQKGGCG